MTRLLVSVRDAAEADEALGGGAHVIDVKEPFRGALGAGSVEQLAAVAGQVRGQVPLSAAAGELLDPPPDGWLAALADYSFAKVGLSRCVALADWPQRWEAFARRLPHHLSVVAVAYADYRTAGAPPPSAIYEVARLRGWPWLLVDTFEKSHGSLLDLLSEHAIAQLVAAAHRDRIRVALAGSLTLAQVPRAAALGADMIAVRGAACAGVRTGRVTADRVRRVGEKLTAGNQ